MRSWMGGEAPSVVGLADCSLQTEGNELYSAACVC